MRNKILVITRNGKIIYDIAGVNFKIYKLGHNYKINADAQVRWFDTHNTKLYISDDNLMFNRLVDYSDENGNVQFILDQGYDYSYYQLKEEGLHNG